MRLIIFVVVGILFASSIGMAQNAASQQKKYFVSIEQLRSVLKTRDIDQIKKTMNNIKSMSYQGMILPFVKELWDGRKDKYPELPWDVLKYDVVRIEIADILLQARRNRRIEFDPAPMVQFAHKVFISTDTWARMTAAKVLGITETDDAVAVLLTEAARENHSTFRAIAITLGRMCNPNANAAMEALLKRKLSQSNREFIREQKTAWENLKQKHGLCSGYNAN